MTVKRPLVLTVGGSDPSSGAGIQVDLKVFEELGVYGLSAISALTAQNSEEVFDVFTPPPDSFKLQLEVLFKDLLPNIIKVGMLSNQDNVMVLKEQFLKLNKKRMIVDPVFVASSSMPLLTQKGREALIEHLLPLSLIVTPNVDEAEALSGLKIKDVHEMQRAASIINDLGPKWVLIKGGHHEFEKNVVEDLIYDGVDYTTLKYPRLDKKVRGTGCIYASAIACFLAKGLEELEAIKKARDFVQQKIEQASVLGKGRPQL
ncbi:MAG: bifunctional hydroxymethylpyrimidine kinase/phosphomethylpyrimidine kinase [Actinobacteria bacterium]|nr:MAG: bifunctional hydroxymethylpyrimidine kinase/phosphomethylpyrimidine kinase [Actinomycetota bacterium]